MLAGRILNQVSKCSYSTISPVSRQLPILPNADIDTFRIQAFQTGQPVLLPRQTFKDVAAIRKWFIHGTSNEANGLTTTTLNHSYLSRFGSVIVPLEITNGDHFVRTPQALSFFLACVNASSSTFEPPRPATRYFSSRRPGSRSVRRIAKKPQQQPADGFFSSASAIPAPTARVYLAQASIPDLPRMLQDDVGPIPKCVLEAGKGDVYDSSIWLGQAPTYTPLHRDPNPNLFVQLAGTKRVRLLRPEIGGAVFHKVQERIGGTASATMRGEEMMAGPEKIALEQEIWGDKGEFRESLWEAELEAGDGLFIPKGWWHSIKGTGEGMTGSVNWWFR